MIITLRMLQVAETTVATFETVHGNHRGRGGEPLLHLLVPPDQTTPSRTPVTFSRAVFYRVVAGKLTVMRQIGDNFGLFQHLSGVTGTVAGGPGDGPPELHR